MDVDAVWSSFVSQAMMNSRRASEFRTNLVDISLVMQVQKKLEIKVPSTAHQSQANAGG